MPQTNAAYSATLVWGFDLLERWFDLLPDRLLEGCVEVEHVGYLEADSVDEHQIPADEYMPVARIRRRKHDLQLSRARLHSATQARRQRAIHNQLPLESGRQTISLGKSARQIRVVRAIPIMNIAIAISVVAASVTIAVFAGLMPMTVIFMAVLPAITIVAIAMVFIVAAAMLLRDGDSGRKC